MHTVLWYVWYAILALGIPGNILSAIVWLRRRVVSKNSSAVYLAALAISDLVYLPLDLYYEHCSLGNSFWFCIAIRWLLYSTALLEPLLVLGFSVERLIAILRALQVCSTVLGKLGDHYVGKPSASQLGQLSLSSFRG